MVESIDKKESTPQAKPTSIDELVHLIILLDFRKHNPHHAFDMLSELDK